MRGSDSPGNCSCVNGSRIVPTARGTNGGVPISSRPVPAFWRGARGADRLRFAPGGYRSLSGSGCEPTRQLQEIMSTKAPLRARQSYRHEAFLWRDRADFLDGLVPFVIEGLEAGEPVLAIAHPGARGLDPGRARAASVRGALRRHARARSQPVTGPAGPAGVPRPVVRTRSSGPRVSVTPCGRSSVRSSSRRCSSTKRSLNLTVDPDLPFWLVCAYPVDARRRAAGGRRVQPPRHRHLDVVHGQRQLPRP